MFNSAFRVARVWGIPIKLHVSLIIVFLILGVETSRAGGGPATVLQGFAIYALVLLGIALHELGHSFVAIRKGCRVREITLLFIGGVAQMEQIPQRPRDEFQMAIAGPAVSFVLGGVLLAAGILVMGAAQLRWMYKLGEVILVAGIVNCILGGFNLVPAFPMDGGRVLRSLLSAKLGRLRATFVAARLGKIVAILFGFIGWFGIAGVPFLRPRHWFLIVIAFFIYSAAGNEYRAEQIKEARRKRSGQGGWDPFTGACGPPPDSEDEVLIGPPPYGREPEQRTEIRHLDGNG